MRKLIGPIAAVALLLTLAMPVAAADKVTLCHATNSASNPYVQIEISLGGLNGHKAPNGDFHVNAKTGLQDFLLAETDLNSCDDTPDDLDVTPLAPGVSGATCEAAGVLTLTEVEGVVYTIDPAYEEGDSGEFTVTAEADEGFTIAEGAETEFDVTVPEQLDCAAGVAPSVSGATCAAPGALSLNAVAGVTYDVTPAYAAGAAGSFTVTAMADAGVTLTGPTVFVVNVPTKLVCNDGTLGGNPTPTPAQGSIPNTAMGGPASGDAPIAMLALLAIAGVAYIGHRNVMAIRGRS